MTNKINNEPKLIAKFKKLHFDKILFESKINQIKNKFWKNYFLRFFELKIIIIKFLCFIIIGAFVLGLSFGVRDLMLNHYPDKIVLNRGVSFSLFENISEIGIRLIQIIPVIGLFIVFIFINDWYLLLAIPFAMFGGFANFIDRFIDDHFVNKIGEVQYGYNTVVDYISAKHSTFNIPDIFIVSGIVGLLIGIVAKIIISSYKEEKENKELIQKNAMINNNLEFENKELNEVNNEKEIKEDNDHQN